MEVALFTTETLSSQIKGGRKHINHNSFCPPPNHLKTTAEFMKFVQLPSNLSNFLGVTIQEQFGMPSTYIYGFHLYTLQDIYLMAQSSIKMLKYLFPDGISVFCALVEVSVEFASCLFFAVHV